MPEIDPFKPLDCESCAFERTTSIIEVGVVSTPGYPPEKAKVALGACVLRRRAVRANLYAAADPCDGNLTDKDGERICRDLGALNRALDALSPVELVAIYEQHKDNYSHLGLNDSPPPPPQGNYL